MAQKQSETDVDAMIGKLVNSISYCGLICALCHLAAECDGCRSDSNACSKHLTASGCFQRACCTGNNLQGCWECDRFPCHEDMYSDSHDPKIKAFARYIRNHGAEEFISRILINRDKGLDVKYGGDYDNKTESEATRLIDRAKP